MSDIVSTAAADIIKKIDGEGRMSGAYCMLKEFCRIEQEWGQAWRPIPTVGITDRRASFESLFKLIEKEMLIHYDISEKELEIYVSNLSTGADEPAVKLPRKAYALGEVLKAIKSQIDKEGQPPAPHRG